MASLLRVICCRTCAIVSRENQPARKQLGTDECVLKKKSQFSTTRLIALKNYRTNFKREHALHRGTARDAPPADRSSPSTARQAALRRGSAGRCCPRCVPAGTCPCRVEQLHRMDPCDHLGRTDSFWGTKDLGLRSEPLTGEQISLQNKIMFKRNKTSAANLHVRLCYSSRVSKPCSRARTAGSAA